MLLCCCWETCLHRVPILGDLFLFGLFLSLGETKRKPIRSLGQKTLPTVSKPFLCACFCQVPQRQHGPHALRREQACECEHKPSFIQPQRTDMKQVHGSAIAVLWGGASLGTTQETLLAGGHIDQENWGVTLEWMGSLLSIWNTTTTPIAGVW